MKIRDIVNRDVTTIQTCDQEPIHIPGSIQPHGCLLAVDRRRNLIRYCSNNVDGVLGLPPKAVLNQEPGQILGAGWTELLAGQAPQEEPGYRPFRIGDQEFLVLLHEYPDQWIVELEPRLPDSDLPDLFLQTRAFVLHLEKARNLQDLCARIAEQTRTLTGYDRVMIYRFDRQFNGEVYAESCREDLEPFLGLHYPHTDIPAQARSLYLRNHLRMIPDVHYEPVALLAPDEGAVVPLDLSDVQLRSVSPIHIQYLRNMKVRATLTISLLQEGKLWGLIACHHQEPKLLSPEQRRMALMQGYFLSSQIRVRQVAEEYELNIGVEAHLQQLLNKIDADEDFALKFEQLSSLLHVVNASGCVILRNGELFERGVVPRREKTLELIRWIAAHVTAMQYSTSHLSGRYPAGPGLCPEAAGILYHALGKPTENCIIWFRQEVEQTVNWAGDPGDAVRKQGGELTPRTSFGLWKEVVRLHAAEWRVSELNAASRFATTLQHHFHMLHLQQEDIKLRHLNEQLQKANQELSNINWITSHDLKEPLRKIQIFTSQLLHQEELSESINRAIARIQSSAQRMQQLVEDILSYSIASQKELMHGLTDLNDVLREVQDDLQEEIKAKKARITIDRLPTAIRAVSYQTHQLFTNLISNALKFHREGEAPAIHIGCERVKGSEVTDALLPAANKSYFRITVRDYGIGFDARYEERIFDIFYRLHNRESYSGTGIGLAICKKIMENHQGAIIARGEEGKGASFVLYFPS